MLTVRMCFDARSPLTFTLLDAAPGAVVGFVTDGVHLELGGVFPDPAAAAWTDEPRDNRAFLAEVRPGGSVRRLPAALTDIAA